MTINSPLWFILFSFSALHGIFITLVLLINKKLNTKPTRILAAMVFIISIIMGNAALANTNFHLIYPHFILSSFPLWFLVGPLFYFYIETSLHKNRTFEWFDFAHLIPLIAFLAYFLSFYIKDANGKLDYLNGIGDQTMYYSATTFFLYLYATQILVYTVISAIKLKKHEKLYKLESSDTLILRLEWLNILILLFVIYLGFDFIISIVFYFSDYSGNIYAHISLLILSLFIYFTAYSIMTKPERLFGTLSTTIEKYKQSALKKEDVSDIKDSLLEIMEIEKPFLTETLKLSDLAAMLNVSSHQISQVINQEFNQSFFHFINKYRVEEAKRRLTDPKFADYTILAIALETGFNSNASFYRIFKSEIGMTPSQFMKKTNKENSQKAA